MKDEGRKISMVTCYDYSSARAVDESSVDCILVGDSLAMTMQRLPDYNFGHDPDDAGAYCGSRQGRTVKIYCC